MQSFSCVPACCLVVALAALGGCVTAPAMVRDREAHWRDVLEAQAPAGTSRFDVESLLRDNGLQPKSGTYRVVRNDGSESSNCRLPERALSALERGAVRGLYLNWDIEVTVCFDENDAVEAHYVGAWNAGI